MLPRRAALAALALPFAAPALAQPWPSRPIRVIVPFPAGGSADASARLIAEHLRGLSPAGAVVENRTGAGGNIAAAEAARSAPDGHALFVGTSGTQAINQSLYPRLPFDPERDFEAVSFLWDAPNLLVVNPALPARSVPELAALARERGGLTYGSSGVGSATHLAGEMLRRLTGAPLTHVPYRGQGPALLDLTAGRLDLMLPLVPDVSAQLAAGAVRALALAARERSEVVPEVPSAAEAGLPGLISDTWTALYAPAETPAPVLAALREAVLPYVQGPEFAARMRALGVVVRAEGAEAFAERTASDRRRWAALISELGLRLE